MLYLQQNLCLALAFSKDWALAMLSLHSGTESRWKRKLGSTSLSGNSTGVALLSFAGDGEPSNTTVHSNSI
jgi:hypothetical protein